MRVAGGGGCNDSASLQRLHDTYKSSEYHFVSADTGAHADVCKRIKDAGMKPVYDIEMAVWVNSGFNVGYDISFMRPALQAIKDAGWQAFSSEGISAKQVSVLREYLPFINYGGERGEDVYANGSMYYRPRSMADGNYNETYHKESVNEYHAALKSAAAATPNNMGVTLMLYTNATLEMDNAAMVNFMQAAIDGGVRLNTVLFWAGVSDCPTGKLDGAFNPLYHALDDKFGFKLEGDGNNMFLDAVRGTDNHVWYQTYKDGVYSKWISIGGVTTSDVHVQYDPETGTFDVRVRGTDNTRWHNYYDPKTGKWSGWGSAGGLIRDICL